MARAAARASAVGAARAERPAAAGAAGCHNLRPVPRDISLEEVFLHREERKVRSDGTIRWGSGFCEVPGEYVGQRVELRHAPMEPERAPLLHIGGKRVCEAPPLDRLANNKRPRRDLPRPEPAPRRSLKGPLDYITDEYDALLRAFGDDLPDPEDRP